MKIKVYIYKFLFLDDLTFLCFREQVDLLKKLIKKKIMEKEKIDDISILDVSIVENKPKKSFKINRRFVVRSVIIVGGIAAFFYTGNKAYAISEKDIIILEKALKVVKGKRLLRPRYIKAFINSVYENADLPISTDYGIFDYGKTALIIGASFGILGYAFDKFKKK